MYHFNQNEERNDTYAQLKLICQPKALQHAYSNILKILPPKTENFQVKNSNIFHISAQNIDCGYSLELSRRGGSNEYAYSLELPRRGGSNEYAYSLELPRRGGSNEYSQPMYLSRKNKK